MAKFAIEEERYLTVTELASMLRLSLESEFPRVSFEGEVSGVKRAASGHIYLTLKDEKSQIPAVIWNGTVKVDFQLEDGAFVYCQGKVTVYPAQGRLQIILSKISEAGQGLLQKRFLTLKKKLEAEGLFAPERKRQIPFLPRAVGVVTSDRGAVIKDIMVKIHGRMPSMNVYLVPVRVQGKGAAEEIAEGIKVLNRSGLVDVIIVGRGGGSLEDLWAFNEEVVARAIYASAIPIVSAVGHEGDVALSDLVADVRAPTPTAAAEMVVPSKVELECRINEIFQRIADYVGRLDPYWQRLDEAQLRLTNSIKRYLQQKTLGLLNLEGKVRLIEPKNFLENCKRRVILLGERIFNRGTQSVGVKSLQLDKVMRELKFAERRFLDQINGRVDNLEGRLRAIDPSQVLKRGYAIVSSCDAVVTDADQLKVGEGINITFSKGRASAEISSILKE